MLAIILLVGWLLGAFLFALGRLIHILLIIAVILILFRIIIGKNRKGFSRNEKSSP